MTHPDPESIEHRWQAFPAREHPGRAIAGVMIVAAIAMGAAMLGGSTWWAIIALVFLFATLSRFYFPSEYIISSEGISAAYPLTRQFVRWRDVRRWILDSDGGQLSTRSRASVLDGFKAMSIEFGSAAGDAADRIRRHLSDVGSRESASRLPADDAPEPSDRVDGGES